MIKKQTKLLDHNKLITSVYLIQRINLKTTNPLKNPFGAMGDGEFLSKKAKLALNSFSAFDGMGAAQYERDELPNALELMQSRHKKGDLLAVHTILFDDLKVYVLSNCSLLGEVIPVIHALRLKEINSRNGSRFSEVTAKTLVSTDNLLRGWICEDNNPFMFFIDEKMMNNYKNFLETFNDPILNPKYKSKKRSEQNLANLLNLSDEKFEKELNRLLKKKEYLP